VKMKDDPLWISVTELIQSGIGKVTSLPTLYRSIEKEILGEQR
jgi:hypothetical protein